jgi:hypothetical protein
MLQAAPLRRGLAYWSAAPSPVPIRPAPSDIGALHLAARESPDVAAAGDDAGLMQRELLKELREDIEGLRATVDAIARDQTLGAEGGVTQRGDVGGKERKTGRGERNRAVMSDAGALVRST